MDADPIELRLLGCLIEKQRTTPDVYPLTFNGLRAAANQATSREPVMALDEHDIREGMTRLHRRRWARLASGARTGKYRHLLDEALALEVPELAVLAVLMLRGPQTLNELTTRTVRLHPFADAEAVQATLEGLAQRDLAEHLERRPGERETRWRQLLGADEPRDPAAANEGSDLHIGPTYATAGSDDAAPTAAPDVQHRALCADPTPDVHPAPDVHGGVEERVAALEAEVAELRSAVAQMKAELGG